MKNYYQNRNKKKNRIDTAIAIFITVFIIFLAFIAIETRKQLFVVVILTLFTIGLGFYYLSYSPLSKWKEVLKTPFPHKWKKILLDNVSFYNELTDDEKDYFENRIQYFLLTKQITGINTDVDEKIKLLIGASAIIPVFAFPDFEYNNINEILVYPQSFDEEYNTGNQKRILGMVGSGAMNRMMILSKRDILASFNGSRTTDNVALHEFVHLIDKKDGTIDGIPNILIDKAFALPWLKELKKEMNKIKHRKSDINPYAATNSSEFLAVASEYFFMSPKKFQKKHPELYKYFTRIYRKNKVNKKIYLSQQINTSIIT